MIPKVIYQTSASLDLTPELLENRSRIAALNPGWELKLFDDEMARAFIHQHYEPQYVECWDSIDPAYGAARADWFRYLLIYKMGGVYLDIKSTTSRPLDEVLKDSDRYLLSHWNNAPDGKYPLWGIHPELKNLPQGEFQQWFIIAEPAHPYLRKVIDCVYNNLINYSQVKVGVGKQAVISTTGPIAYTQAILPILSSDLSRLVESEKDLGLRYTIFEEIGLLEHVKRLPSHYEHVDSPLVSRKDKLMNILIATPSYGGSVTTAYFYSINNLTAEFRRLGIKSTIAMVNYAQVDKVRSYFASRLLLEEFSHLLFVDADMAFSPQAVLSMIELEESLVAAAYPKRSVDFQRMQTAFQGSKSYSRAMATGMDFVFEQSITASLNRESVDGSVNLRNGKFLKCDVAGTGLMLIRKDTIEKLLARFPELWLDKPAAPYRHFGEELSGTFQIFESIRNSEGVFMSEDASFCKRWTEGCAGDLWLNVVDPIGHVGTQMFSASFADRYRSE